MPRVKRGKTALKRRHKILKQTKGFRFDLGNKERAARTAILHAGVHAFRGRRDKKGDFRRLWNIQINAAVRPLGLSYSKFIDALAKKNIAVNRKMIASLAQEHPETFRRLMDQVKA